VPSKSPFLNLDREILEKPLLFEDCLLEGFLARGTHFQQTVQLRHCGITGRIQMNTKRNEEEPTCFHQDLKLESCFFEGSFTLKESRIQGEVLIRECHFSEIVSFDRVRFEKKCEWIGPGSFQYCTMFMASFSQGFMLQNYHFKGGQNQALDLNQIEVEHGFILKACRFDNVFDFKKASVRNTYQEAWKVEDCHFDKIHLQESIFEGKVQILQSHFKQECLAETPKQEGFKKTGRPTLFKEDLAFIDCQFHEKVSFQGTRFLKYVNFKKCFFHKEASFNQAEFGQLLSFWEVEALGSFFFRKAHFQGRTQFGRVQLAAKTSWNEAVFEEEFSIFDSTIQGDLFFSRASFAKEVKFRSVHFRGGLGMEKVQILGFFGITNSDIEDRFILTESQLEGLTAFGLEIGTWASLAKCTLQGDVSLGGIRVGTKIPLQETQSQQPAEIQDSQSLQSSKVPEEKGEKDKKIILGSFYAGDSLFYGNLNLSKARIHGQVDLEQTNGHGEFDLSNISVGQDLVLSKSYFRSMVHLEGAEFQNLFCHRTRFKEEASFNHLKGKNVSLAGTSFDGGFTLRSATISDVLTLNEVDVDGKIDLFKTTFKDIYFNHLLVDHFLVDRSAFGKQLTSEYRKNYTQAKNEYSVLKQAFLQRSNYQDMDWAYYRFCRASRKEKKFSWLRPWRIFSTFFDWLLLDIGFGYGTRPMNIGGVALALILGFACIFYYNPQGLIGPENVPLTSLTFPSACYLSIITFASMDYGDCSPTFNHDLKYLFSLEGLLGIFLTTLFVATISRKIIRT
jgi:hypothetical protein